MKTIVKQGHVEWLEQQIELCTSVINNQMQRQVALKEALENAKGISGSATLVEVPKAGIVYPDAPTPPESWIAARTEKMNKAEGIVFSNLVRMKLSPTELCKTTGLKRSTIHTAVWSLRKNFDCVIKHNDLGQYVLLSIPSKEKATGT